MQTIRAENLDAIYPACLAAMGPAGWRRLVAACGEDAPPERLPEKLTALAGEQGMPDFLPELARLEWTRHSVATNAEVMPHDPADFEVNPTLEVLKLSWRVAGLLNAEKDKPAPMPQPGVEWALVWRDPHNGPTKVAAATDEELLVLKMLVEELAREAAAAEAGITVGVLESAMYRAADKGFLLAPRPLIRRDQVEFPSEPEADEKLLASESFTIQWHITNACDLRCKHCYDRSRRSAPTLEQGLRILDDFRSFCRSRHVRGHVCLTGGNPLLHPDFFELYRAAAARGFGASILGNAAAREQVRRLIDIRLPSFYQVSLEGLPEHNDAIRGAGYFARVIEFLGVLRDLGVQSSVMLTLTRDNIDQVPPLAERLRGHADCFTFNRLSPVGEGANLLLPTRERYAAFLGEYVAAAEKNPIMGLKDNLINIVRRRRGMKLFGGCTGHGCGAAFSFLAILPDGETHACRKFPSPIGNALEQGIGEIYDSDAARRYRRGAEACRGCCIRPACGGCMAIARAHGLDIFRDRDPHCFMDATQGELQMDTDEH